MITASAKVVNILTTNDDEEMAVRRFLDESKVLYEEGTIGPHHRSFFVVPDKHKGKVSEFVVKYNLEHPGESKQDSE